jgi:hypothetical protein
MTVQGLKYFALTAFFSALLAVNPLFSQEDPGYEEISVFLSIPRIGGADISALIKEDEAYLSVNELFSLLKIKNTYSAGFDTISGFIQNEKTIYKIIRDKNLIIYNNKTYNLDPESIIRTETNLYLKAKYFGSVFNLDCSFNIRNLTVTLNSKIELPLIKEMRFEQMRKNLSQIKGEIVADTTYKSNYPLLNIGMADWSLITSQSHNENPDIKFTFKLGSVMAGGETNIFLNYDNSRKFSEKDQYYSWRYVNNDNKLIRQLEVGKFTSESISTLNSPLTGFRFSNSPTTYRNSYGTYKLTDFTEPGWTVELYVNNVLVDYKKADASGLYTFDVPLVYGSTNIKLMFYGLFGEERSREQSITIPFNFLPKGVLEYTFSGGLVRDSLYSKFARFNFDYGVNRSVTVGGGVEYLTRLDSMPYIPFVRSSFRVFKPLLFSAEYVHNVRFKSVMSANLSKEIQLELDYVRYDKNQHVVNSISLEERKIALSMPLRLSKLNLFTKLSYGQTFTNYSQYNSADILMSGGFLGINTNISANALFARNNDPIITANMAMAYIFPHFTTLTQQFQFDVVNKNLSSFKTSVEKKISKSGYANISYERNIKAGVNNIEFGFRIDFNFAQMALNVRNSNRQTRYTESASGSIILDSKTNYLGFNKRPGAGMGGISVYPFLDINNNGIHDKGEPKIPGLKAQINGGRVEYDDKDTVLRVFDLQPYTKYLLMLNSAAFDNISWQMKYKNLSVAVDPNQFKLIKIPITVSGEVAGQVYIRKESTLKGQGRILVNFYKKSGGEKVASVMTESDGFFSFMGLTPGDYNVKIDPVQMSKLEMTASPDTIPVKISNGREGDYIDGLEFIITSLKPSENEAGEKLPDVVPADNNQKEEVENKTVANNNIEDKNYRIQLIVLKKKISVEGLFKELMEDIPQLKIDIVLLQDGLYHYVSQKFATREEAKTFLRLLHENGWNDAFITMFIDNKREFSTVWPYSPSKGDTYYSIQLIAVAHSLDIRKFFEKLLSAVPDLNIYENIGADGIYRYHTNPFGSLSKAQKYVQILKRAGWEDCYITVNKAE